MRVTRRRFMHHSAAVAAGFMGLRAVSINGRAFAASDEPAGFGPLVEDSQGVFDLPRGFTYAIIARAGLPMYDGLLVPGAPDGMAAFPAPSGRTIVICNHEVNPDQQGPWGENLELLSRVPIEKLYDAGPTPGTGGTTTLIYDTKARRLVSHYLSLAGTYRNCAGGATPWGSWVTCEETVQRAGPEDKHGRFTAQKDHGYNFEVPAREERTLVDPIPLKAMGRFHHEAIAVDPRSGVVYQTEDRDDGLLYRFIPEKPGDLKAGGRLQALALRDVPGADTRNWRRSPHTMPMNEPLEVRWIDMDEVDSPDDDLRNRGQAAGAAVFARGEGMWTGSDGIYFACTNGGTSRGGQIFRYVPSPHEAQPGERESPGSVELFIEPNDGNLVQNADNLTVAPWGDLIVCEDRGNEQARLIGVTPAGRLYTFAFCHLQSELAGACFSPDGSTLFVNIQNAGLMLAVTGPWTQRAT